MYDSRYLTNYLSEKKGELNLLTSQLEILEKKLDNETNNYEIIVEAQSFLQNVAKQTQQRLSFHISDFVSNALESIWSDEAYTFKLDFIEKRNKTEVTMYLIDDHGIISLRDLNSVRGGGGVLDVVAFALRVALWSLQQDKVKIMILDQPFQNLDNEHMPLAGNLLNELSDKLGIQFILINHNPILSEIADATYIVHKKNGVSVVS